MGQSKETEIRTRHGLILERIISIALDQAGFVYEQDVQYDSTCEKPDFLIPDSHRPKYMIEVHQTDIRASFAMKIFRAFTAVTEAKAHYGANLITINFLFGDPDTEISSRALSALCAIYDHNIFPRRNNSICNEISRIEIESLLLASELDRSTIEIIKILSKKYNKEIEMLGSFLSMELKLTRTREELKSLWASESKRIASLGNPPLAGNPTYYKRMMLGALFFGDKEFKDLVNGIATMTFRKETIYQLIRVGLATVEELIDGDHLLIKPEFISFLSDAKTPALRATCKKLVDSIPNMHWYFEDIRDQSRRSEMATHYFASLCSGKEKFHADFVDNILTDAHFGIEHTRSWYADLMAVQTKQGFNYFNKAICADRRYDLKLWSPFNNLALKWSAHEKNPDYANRIARILTEILFSRFSRPRPDDSDFLNMLADGLQDFRVFSSIKLKKMNPLIIAVAAVCQEKGLTINRVQIKNLMFDLADDSGVGKFAVYFVSDKHNKRSVMLNMIAVHDGHGDDKSKEWGARRVASMYRVRHGSICQSGFDAGIFVIDGDWEDKHVARLFRSGWNHVCRLNDLEKTLEDVFGTQSKVKSGEISDLESLLAESD